MKKSRDRSGLTIRVAYDYEQHDYDGDYKLDKRPEDKVREQAHP
jgi:hypothetical protein